MSPFGCISLIFSSGVLNGTISVYTFASRILRPMSCVYCPPKSRMRIVSNFDDILPHYSNRGEPHEQQVTVQNIQKNYNENHGNKHGNCIRRSRNSQHTSE